MYITEIDPHSDMFAFRAHQASDNNNLCGLVGSLTHYYGIPYNT